MMTFSTIGYVLVLAPHPGYAAGYKLTTIYTKVMKPLRYWMVNFSERRLVPACIPIACAMHYYHHACRPYFLVSLKHIQE